MKLDFLSPVHSAPGPVASVYVDTSRYGPDPDRAVALRWRALRERLLAHDADPATVSVLEEAVGGDGEAAGRHGRALFASAGRLLLSERVPEPPAVDGARFGIVPDALPLALQHAPDIAYSAVRLHRVHRVPPDEGDDLEIAHETGRWPLGQVAAVGRMRATVPAEGPTDWADALADELADSVDLLGSEVLVVSGHPWAANTLLGATPYRLRDAFVRVKNGRDIRPEPGRALLEGDLAELFADRLSASDERQLDAFAAQRARGRDRTEGLGAVVPALQRGQARALVLNPGALGATALWVGPEPTHLAGSGAELASFGVGFYWEDDAGAALLRAAVGTGAELIAVPRDVLPLEDGVGVLLRYTDAFDPTPSGQRQSAG